jgi:hypothetical protein
MQERQHASFAPTSPIHGDGDASSTRNSGGDVLVSEVDQQAQDMGTQVLHMLVAFFSSNCSRY